MKLIVIAATLAATVLVAAAQPAKEPYVPGLGEFMTATQLRHAKLWFAGRARNWDLAAYEVDEIKEGLEDAIKQVPVHEGLPVGDMIKTILLPALDDVDKAVDAKNSAQFTTAFDKLTLACNTCHAGAKKEFIRIQRPTAPPVTNQNFAPGK
jgi:hypothetical protein